MHKVDAICVFCGSSPGSRPDYAMAATQLGALLAGAKIRLIYGGGNVGLMGTLANACMAADGEVIGIIPEALFQKEHGHRNISRLEVVSSMHERKARMAALSDGFVALPGGIGTFEEVLEVLTWSQLGIHEKPVVLLNIANYFGPLLALIENAIREGFLGATIGTLLTVCDEPREIVTHLSVMRSDTSPHPSALGI